MNELETIPTYEMQSFCRQIAKLAEKYFEDPENKRRFEEWEKEQELRRSVQLK